MAGLFLYYYSNTAANTYAVFHKFGFDAARGQLAVDTCCSLAARDRLTSTTTTPGALTRDRLT